MDIVYIYFIILGLIILILAIFNIFLLKQTRQTNQKIDKLLEKGKVKEFKDILLSQKEKNSELEERIKEVFLEIENLQDICKKTIQKIGIVRFNPFSDVGGNQSFSIALLDDKNNGFVISSLFLKEGNRVYAKTIKNGKSDYLLSEEEVEAVKRALDSE